MSEAVPSTTTSPAPKKPLYKKAWFWLLIVLAIIVLIFAGCATLIAGAIGASEDVSEPTAVESSEGAAPEADAPADAPAEEESSAMTTSQKSAISKAESYVDFQGFSRDGLVTQLEFDKFSNEDASFAADNIDVDYNEQAAKKAKSYLDLQGFSRDGLITQLEFDKFTPEQAAFGADSVGL